MTDKTKLTKPLCWTLPLTTHTKTALHRLINWISFIYLPAFPLTTSLFAIGVNCEINQDDCASNPCQHGSCEDGINEYKCVCEPGYTGLFKHIYKYTHEDKLHSLIMSRTKFCVNRTYNTLYESYKLYKSLLYI